MAAAITSIQVTTETVAALRRAKEEMGVGTYDDVVQRLLMDRAKRRMNLVGIAKGIGPFDRKDRGHRD